MELYLKIVNGAQIAHRDILSMRKRAKMARSDAINLLLDSEKFS